MPQLDSGLGSAETLLEMCWKAAVAAATGAVESCVPAGDQNGLVERYCVSNETKSRKLEKTTDANTEYEGMRDCLIAIRQRTAQTWRMVRDSRQ